MPALRATFALFGVHRCHAVHGALRTVVDALVERHRAHVRRGKIEEAHRMRRCV